VQSNGDDDSYGAGQFIALSGDRATPDNIAIVIEGEIVMDNVEDFATAVCFFFAMHYILNLEYANGTKSRMFECIQKMFLKIGSNMSPKLMSLNKKLQS